jgi:UDP-N-acetylglucosamine 3-dehydrogenase
MAKEKVKVGVIGCGLIAQTAHLPWYWENPTVEIVAVCADIEEQAKTAAKRWDAKQWFTDYKKLLAIKEIDAVSICTPLWMHKEISVAASKAGKHVLCEKPMARNSQEAKEMVDAAEAAGKKLMIGFMKRFNPGFLKIKEIIDKGTIGKVYHTDIHWNLYFPPNSHVSKIFSEDERIGGGVVLDNCSHYIDLFRWLINSEVDSVVAETSTIVPERIYEDQASIIMRFKNKATSILDMGFNRVEWVEQTGWDKKDQGYAYQFSELGFIYGTEGTMTFDSPPFDSVEPVSIKLYLLKGNKCEFGGWHQLEIPLIRQPGGPMAPNPVQSYPFKRQIDHFVDCIANDKPLGVSGLDGRTVVEISDAIYKSAKSGNKVFL